MLKPKLTIIALAIIFLASCKKENAVSTASKEIQPSKKEKQVIDASNKFSFSIWKEFNSHFPKQKNYMFSPFSISSALSMAWNGAATQTKEEMGSVLGFSNQADVDVNFSYQNLSKALQNIDKQVVFTNANSIWYNKGFEVVPSYLENMKNFYDAKVETLDFTNSSSKDIINKWVSDNTNAKIPSIVDEIPVDAVMYLINAIYFKGTWKYRFEPANTKEMEFTKESGEKIKLPFMSQKTNLNFYISNKFAAAELPYNQGNFNMVAILPNGGNVDSLVASFSTEKWSEILNGFKQFPVNLFLPKFKFETDTLLNDYLKEMGMPLAFSSLADFSAMRTQKDIFISKVKHKTYIEVNEDGAEAAAATSVEFKYTSVEGGDVPAILFELNRPFLFVIYEKSSGTILFAGKVAGKI